jgi:H+/Cl- antiporter ClcA
MERALFNSVEQALQVMLTISARLSALVVWLAIVIAHLAAFLLLIAAVWWWQVTPTDVTTALTQAAKSKPFAVLTVAGVSALTLIGGYWRLAKWAHRAAGSGWMFGYLMRGL